MKTIPTTLIIAGILACSLSAGTAIATTYGADPPVEAALRDAETVLAGYFSGATKTHERTIKNVMNDEGEVFDDVVKYTAFEFVVTDVVDGQKVPEVIEINVRGAVEIPSPKRRVVVGVAEDPGSPTGGYLAVYSRFIEMKSESEMNRA